MDSTWMDSRKGKFTASAMYKLFTQPKSVKDREAGYLSETAKSYIEEVAIEELTGYRKDFGTSATEHGNKYEEEAFEMFKQATGLNFDFTSKTFYPFGGNSGASPDGVLYEDLSITAVVDIKCPYSPLSFYEQKEMLMNCAGNKTQGVPPAYFYQLQTQMMATGARIAYLARYLANEIEDTKTGAILQFNLPISARLYWAEVTADQDIQDEILMKLRQAEIYKQQIIQNFLKQIN
jgi:hypothetical protein